MLQRCRGWANADNTENFCGKFPNRTPSSDGGLYSVRSKGSVRTKHRGLQKIESRGYIWRFIYVTAYVLLWNLWLVISIGAWFYVYSSASSYFGLRMKVVCFSFHNTNSSIRYHLPNLNPQHVTCAMHRHIFLSYRFNFLLQLFPLPHSGHSLQNRGITLVCVKSLKLHNRKIHCCRHKTYWRPNEYNRPTSSNMLSHLFCNYTWVAKKPVLCPTFLPLEYRLLFTERWFIRKFYFYGIK